MFPTNNAQQTLTIDSCFWNNQRQLTFYASGHWYTIWGTTDTGVHHIHIGISTDAYGNGTSELAQPLYSPYNANLGSSSGFLSWALSQTTASGAVSGTALLTTAEIDGGTGKDVIQGISNNTQITNIITGGAGADILTGGIGKNFYVYNSYTDSPLAGQLNSGGNLAQSWDQITNFHVGADKLDLDLRKETRGQGGHLGHETPAMSNLSTLFGDPPPKVELGVCAICNRQRDLRPDPQGRFLICQDCFDTRTVDGDK